MKTETIVLIAFVLLVAVAVTAKHSFSSPRTGVGAGYVYQQGPRATSNMTETGAHATRKQILEGPRTDAEKQLELSRIQRSVPRTIGVWVAAFFTLAVFSFLYRDNPFYKFAEHAFVGVSAAYWMVIGYWDTIVPNLLGNVFPRWTKFNLLPGHDLDKVAGDLEALSWFSGSPIAYEPNGNGLVASTIQLMNLPYLVPLALGIMLLWRLAPRGAWIARWPLAFILGTTAGFRLCAHVESDFLKQIQQALVPIWAPAYDGTGALLGWQSAYESFKNFLLTVGTLCALVYFFFSVEHRGVVGRISRVGIWVLMITFGAGFGMTVMGRVALLTGRFDFLLGDWLNVAPQP